MNVQPRRLSRSLAIGLAAGALAAPAASAMPAPPDPPPQPLESSSAPIVQSVDAGFDWGSAAIGAGALVLLVSVGGVSYRYRRDQVGMAR